MFLINSSPKNSLKIFQPFLPISVPIGVGCLAAVLERAGVEVVILDEQVEDDVLGKIAAAVKKMEKPYIFGFSVLTAALKSAVGLSKKLKELYPDSVIIFGGIHPTAMPHEVMAYGHIDFVLRGEAEKSLLELYCCLKTKSDYTEISGLSYRINGRVAHNLFNYVADNLDSYPPFPYQRFAGNRRYDLGFVVSSRGCPYRCIFCSNRIITGRRYRYKSASLTVNELEVLNGKYGKNFAVFLDDNLLVSRERIYSLIEEIKRRGLHKRMTFSFQSRGDNVSETLLKDLFSAGFKSVFFGMETSSEKIMKIVQKDETVAQCVAAAKMAKKIGYYVSATFIYGFPEETREDRMNCVKLSQEIGLDQVRYNNATPYPGTELYNIAVKENRLNVQGLYDNFISVSTFVENPFKRIPFSYVPIGSAENALRRDILFSYFSFYLNVNRLKQILSNPEQGAGWFSAGKKIQDLAKKAPGLVFLGLMFSLKFCQLFYYTVIKPETCLSLAEFLKIFRGGGFPAKHHCDCAVF